MIAITYFSNKAHWSVTLILMIVSIITRIGYNKIFLRISNNETPKFTDVFQEYKLFWKYLGVSILHGLVIIGGLILLIIPGIIWAVRFSFAPLILVDTSMGPIASMKESYAITRDNFWPLLLFWLAIGILNIFGFIIFGVGLLVSVPISTFATIYVYRALTKMKAGVVVTASPQTVLPVA
jgi:uncharacterized membrane protein